MALEPYYVTDEAYKKLKSEYEDLMKNKRSELAKRIQEAKELGDLSENAEYEEARTAQSFLEGRIEELNDLLRRASPIRNHRMDVVTVGATVEVEDWGKKAKKSFTIVGIEEADPLAGKISNISPLGKILLGESEGAAVKLKTPKGEITYKILRIK
ncbi:MAG: transcription elongation factor GreA [Candidatus Parcubacteria bacterium]|nr:transcription elongation factor GreA [Candidatus Parcubacteria bacterium]